MSKELIEAVTRAAWEMGAGPGWTEPEAWDELDDEYRQREFAFTRNVIRALKEHGPSEGMIEAAVKGSRADVSYFDAEECFTAMLTALIEESDNAG